MKNVFKIYVSCAITLYMTTTSFGQILNQNVPKKLIEFSWDSPTTAQYAEKISFYENVPFDGISVKLTKEVGGGNIFMVNDWEKVTPEAKQNEFENIAKIGQSRRLNHNFLVLYGASQMDWFSDDHWKLVEENIRFGARLAKIGGFKGILWDPEPYKPGKNPWKYDDQKHKELLSYAQYYEQVVSKGKRFIEIIREEFPGAVIFSLRELSDFQCGSPFSQFVLPVTDEKKTMEVLNSSWWGLHLAFTIGNIQALDSQIKFVDGNEEAYYYTSPIEYYKFRDVIYNDGLALVPEPYRNAFRENYSIGHAIAIDYMLGNWAGLLTGFTNGQTCQGKVLTHEQRKQWFEHNLYYSLATADEYAWLYSEKLNWWTLENVPEGFVDAIKSANLKANNKQPLGFNVDEMLRKARDKAAKEYPEKK